MNLESQVYWKSLIGMSTCKFFLMKILYKAPGYGYAILEKMRSYTEGHCTATYGTIYTILNNLANEGLARVKFENIGNRKRKIYELTKRGRRAYIEALKAWDGILPYISKAVENDLYELPVKASAIY